MYQYVSRNTFIDTFKEVRPDNFNYDGLMVLFDHLEELEQEEGKMRDFDVIDICCTYSQKTAEELFQDYGYRFEGSDKWHLGQWRDALSEETPAVLSVYKTKADQQVLDSLIILDF